MKTQEARDLTDQLLKEVGKKGNSEPGGRTIALAIGGALINLARIADALEERNQALRAGSWANQNQGA